MTSLVDPCGEEPPRPYADADAQVAEGGWYACTEDGLLWTTDASVPATRLEGPSCGDIRVRDGRLWLAADGTLLLYDAPGATPMVLADDVDMDAGGGEYVAWEYDIDEAPNVETAVLLETGETATLPGPVSRLSFRGYVTTSDPFLLVAVYDVAARRTIYFGGPGYISVVRIDGNYAYLLADDWFTDLTGNVELLDLTTGATRRLAERVGPKTRAWADPVGEGIYLYEVSLEEDAGRLLRVERDGVEIVAENIVENVLFAGRDDRVLYFRNDPQARSGPTSAYESRPERIVSWDEMRGSSGPRSSCRGVRTARDFPTCTAMSCIRSSPGPTEACGACRSAPPPSELRIRRPAV